MKLLKKTGPALLILLALTMSSCLNILEEVTFQKSGAGHYKMSIDMGQMKDMMAMLKAMAPADSTGAEAGGMGEAGDQLGQLGGAFDQMADLLKGVRGLSNITTINDTAAYVFGYEFDFADVEALNKAVKKIADQEGGGNVPDEIFDYKKGKFEREDASGNMVETIQKAMMGDDAEQAKMIFADMTATTVYKFPGQKVSKQDHKFGKVSDDGESVTIEMKPFADGAELKKMTSEISIKLK